MNYLVNLDKFYGPLDLLLYLLEKEEMDIYDIPVALIADQYIQYLQTTGRIDLENIGDFLSMASYLLNLKSRMLLPGAWEEEADEAEMPDPREELVQRIMEYKQYKQAAELLATRFDADHARVFFRQGRDEIEAIEREICSSLGVLLRAWQAVLARSLPEPKYILPENDVDVGEKMQAILQRLPANGAVVLFQDFLTGISSRREALAYFLGLLELVRLQKVEASQEQRFGAIRLCLRVAVEYVDAG
ncbi:MAG: condensin subunit ScpA [Chloroflexi bacterium]|nr:condensin subunit ScpA [Chloroflexota bacterium]